MTKLAMLQEELNTAITTAEKLAEGDDLEAAQKAVAEAAALQEALGKWQEEQATLATIRSAADKMADAEKAKTPRVAALQGIAEDAQPGVTTRGVVQPMPGERQLPTGLDAAGHPADWIQGLPAAAQPGHVLQRASVAVQEQAEAEFGAFVEIARVGFDPARVSQLISENPDYRQHIQALTSSNAYTLPSPFLSPAIDNMGDMSKLMTRAEQRTVSTTQGSTAAFGSITGAGYAQTSGPANSEPTNVNVPFSLIAVGARVDVANVAMAGSTTDLMSQLTVAAARGIGRGGDAMIVNGTGASNSQFTGIRGTGGIGDSATTRSQLASNSKVDWDELVDALALVPDEFQDDAVWITNTVNLAVIRASDVGSNKGSTMLGIRGDLVGLPVETVGAATWGAVGTTNSLIAIVGSLAQGYVIFSNPGRPTLVSADSLLSQSTALDQTRISVRQYLDGRLAIPGAFKWVKAKT